MDRQSVHHSGAIATRRPFGSRTPSPFIGRDEELRRLCDALDRAAEGCGSTIFLTGQPGIGKTRLARETLALAKKHGFMVLEGRAFSLQAGLAYAPFLDAFGPLLRSLSPSRLKTLVSGLPDIGRLFSELCLPQPEHEDPALEKTRLFESVSRLLQRLAQEAPVALLMDDVHWADPASIELLHYLARGLADQRALLLATYVIGESDNTCGLHSLLVPLQRRGLAEEISVPALEPEAVDRLVRGILGDELPSHLPALLNARAGGTPLFIEALIDALIDSHSLIPDASEKNGWVLSVEGTTALPPSVRRLILARLERLPPADRRVLDLIAVLGEATPYDILAAASGLDDEALVAVLCRLLSSELVAEGQDGSAVVYSVTHPLVREVAYVEQPEIVRRRAHLAATEALESHSQGRLAETSRLAAHYLGAGPLAKGDRALAALGAAGERALSVYANEEAARHFEAAVAMAREGKGENVTSPSTLASLLERLGDARERIGEREAAIGAWSEALAEQERSGDAVGAARVRCRLALAEWRGGHFDIASSHLEAGMAALSGHELSQELADLHYASYQILGRLGDEGGMAASAAELLSVAGRLASPKAEAEANLVAFISCLWQNDISTARERALQALRIGESFFEGAESMICCQAYNALVLTGTRLGDHRFVRYHAERGIAVAQRIGMSDMEVALRLRLAFAHFMSGDWDEALDCNMKASMLARRAGRSRDLGRALGERAMILAFQGDFQEAEACISEAKLVFGSSSKEGPVIWAVHGLVDIGEATIALERGRSVRALGCVRDFDRPTEPAGARSDLTTAYLPTGLMLLAEAQVATGDLQGALGTAVRLKGLGSPGTPYADALGSRAEGLAQHALGRREAAMDSFARAHDNFTGLGMPFEAAKCLLGQATSALALRPELAARAAQQSLAIFERLHARCYSERARRLLEGLGIVAATTHGPRLGGVAVSKREMEIARLVAQGLTTAEIAKRLILSPFTVDAHLHRIYTRLGIGSRAALTRLVIEAGLLSPQDEIK